MSDPTGRFAWRWWDGQRYTDHVAMADGGATVDPFDPVEPPAGRPAPTRDDPVDEADWTSELLLCRRCERPFFDRRDCPMCGAPVGAYRTAPGLLRDLADGFVRLRDAAYLRVGAVGDPELGALSPAERQRYLAAADGEVQTVSYDQQRHEAVVSVAPEVVIELLHDPAGYAERLARLDDSIFSWIEEDGRIVGYVTEEQDEGQTMRTTTGFLDLDGYDRVTLEVDEVTHDDRPTVVGEVMRTYRPNGVIEQADMRIAGGLHIVVTRGIECRVRSQGCEVLLVTSLDASWPVHLDTTELEEVVDGVMAALTTEELDSLARVTDAIPPSETPRGTDRHDPLVAAIALLGLDPGYAVDDARRAYRQLAQLLHPDRHQGASAEVQRAAADQMARVNEAYQLARSAAELRP